MTWLEAEIIAEPIPTKQVTEPRVLVKRRHPLIMGSREEELVYLPGPAAISLFTGAGGFDLGIEQGGFCVLAQHEIVKEACDTLIANRPRCFRHAALIQGDIRNTPTSMILAEAGLRVGEAHIVFGGPPCQGFTYSNTNRGKGHDERNDLVFEFLRVVREAQPEFFCFENVPGFMELNKGKYFEAFLERAYDNYFELVYGLVEASEYLVPQYRCRFICMGTRRDVFDIDGKLASLPKPICFSNRDLSMIKIFESGPLFRDELDLLTHAPGVRYFPNRPVLRPPMPCRNRNMDNGGRTKTFVEFYRKLRRDEPDRIIEEPQEKMAC